MKKVITLFLAAILSACQQHPTQGLYHLANTNNLTWRTLKTEHYDITALTRINRNATDISSHTHVYIEGDGIPWSQTFSPRHVEDKTVYVQKPNANPTSQNLLALKLMLKDPATGVYLNRPCYGIREMPSTCNPKLWTEARYSIEVVNAMNEALDQLKSLQNIKQFTLIGHSGGGTLAVLIANRRTDVKRLITIAANVDHKAWTNHFNYDALGDSLNAVDELPISPTIERWHLHGVNDEIIPSSLFDQAIEQEKKSANIIKFPNYGHDCCWLKDWPKLLDRFDSNN